MTKKIIIFIIVVGIILGGVWWWMHRSPGVSKVDVNLDYTEREKVDQKIKDTEAEIKNRPIPQSGDEVAMGEYRVAKMRDYLQVGINYETLGELENARQAYIKAAEEYPAGSVAWANLGTLYQKMGRNDLAKQALEKAVELEPGMPINWQKLLDLHRNKLDTLPSDIRTIYARAFQQTNNAVQVRIQFAQFLEGINDLKGAMDEWAGIAEGSPENSAAAKAEIARIKAKL